MKPKNWLIPILTCLIVAAAAAAPQQISALQDRKMSGTVHTEVLTGDNNFSVWSPTLEERISLAAQWQKDSSLVSSVLQSLDGDALHEAERLALAQLTVLTQAGVLPSDTVPEQLSYSSGVRIYLWTPENLGGAGFLSLYLMDTGRDWSVSLLLDEESGKILVLGLNWPPLLKYLDGPLEVGALFFEVQGMEVSGCTVNDYSSAYFWLFDNTEYYEVSKEGCYLFITPISEPNSEDKELPPGPDAVLPGPGAVLYRVE